MRQCSKHFVGLIAALALIVGACGGDSDADGAAATSTTAPTTTAAGSDGAAADDTPVVEDDSGTEADDGAGQATGGGDLSLVPEGETDILGNPAGQGFVELNGARYDFILNAACQKLFGGVQAAGGAADGTDANVDSIIPPDDWETDTAAGWDPPYVQIGIGDVTWRAEAGVTHFVGGANTELGPEQSAVTSFTNDGSRTAGQAVFYNIHNVEEVETATGSFEFYCP